MSFVFSQTFNTYTFSTTCIAKKNTLKHTGEAGRVEAKFISKQVLSVAGVVPLHILLVVVVMLLATVAAVAVPSVCVCVRAF